jgi:cytoskeletal protein RodZ
MESFGAYLKGLREENGKTLDEIAENTKIAVSNLDFLENDRFDLLPPRVFVKGFIRSYIKELGLNPEEAMARFDAFTKDGELPDYEEEEHPVFHQKPASSSFVASKWFTVVLTAAGIISLSILLLTGVSRIVGTGNGEKGSQPSLQTAQPKDYGPEDQAESHDRDQNHKTLSQPAKAQEGKRTLEIKAVANTWVRVVPDSGPAEELMMAPGDVQMFTANKSFTLMTGNAGGIKIWYDGREQPALGKAHETLSLTLP